MAFKQYAEKKILNEMQSYQQGLYKCHPRSQREAQPRNREELRIIIHPN